MIEHSNSWSNIRICGMYTVHCIDPVLFGTYLFCIHLINIVRIACEMYYVAVWKVDCFWLWRFQEYSIFQNMCHISWHTYFGGTLFVMCVYRNVRLYFEKLFTYESGKTLWYGLILNLFFSSTIIVTAAFVSCFGVVCHCVGVWEGVVSLLLPQRLVLGHSPIKLFYWPMPNKTSLCG